jgi:anhydro-N-acetylmuramic acid kinase
VQLIIPSSVLIEFKEALVFAYLGVLRYRNENNCLASVTGAQKNNCGGQIFFVKN